MLVLDLNFDVMYYETLVVVGERFNLLPVVFYSYMLLSRFEVLSVCYVY